MLEVSFIIHFLEPDSNNLGKSVVKTPKLYFVDSGLLCRLLRLEGKDELILSRQKGAVVETFAVELRSSTDPETGKASKVRKYAAARGTDDVRSAVFYLGDTSMQVAQTQFVSWRDWGNFLKQRFEKS